MRIGKDTADYVAALAPKGSGAGKIAGLLAKLKRQREQDKKHSQLVDAFRSHTTNSGKVNDND